MVKLNRDGQGSDNGSKLLVRFLGRPSQKSVFCPISVVRWYRMPKENKEVMWRLIERSFKYKLRNEDFYPNKSKEELLDKTLKNVDSVVDWTAFVHHYYDEKMEISSYGTNVQENQDKILEHLPEDQELACVPLKILAHPNNAIGKVYGSEHSGCVRGLGGNVYPLKDFGMSRNSISHVNLGSSSSISRQRVEDLEKQVEILEEKLIRYEETEERLVETENRLVQNENHLATLHMFLKLNLVASCLFSTNLLSL
ncbi:hypothetical protein FXO37_15448 [Capsicum annuum]|nr:hypothetical protein FXO37_15448 [Capsicum annuum]